VAGSTGIALQGLKIFPDQQEMLAQEPVLLTGARGAGGIFIPLHAQPVPLQVTADV